MNVEIGSLSCFSAVDVAVGTSVAIKVTSTVVPGGIAVAAEILLWLYCIWTTARGCLIRKTSRRDENGSASEKENFKGNDWPYQQVCFNEKRSVKDEELYLLVAVCSKGLACLADNVDVNTSFKAHNHRVMKDKAVSLKKSSNMSTQLAPDLNKQPYRLKQCVHGGDKQASGSSKVQMQKGNERPRSGGHGSHHGGFRASGGWGGSNGDDGGEDGDKRRRQVDKWVSSASAWRTQVKKQSGEETKEETQEQQVDVVEGTEENVSNYNTADLLHITSSPVDIEMQRRRPRDTHSASLLSIPQLTPHVQSMPDPQPHSLQPSTAHPRPKQEISRRASFSQMLPCKLVKQKQQKNVVAKVALEGSIESRVMTVELAFQCQFRNGHDQWKTCTERGCRSTREQFEHYSCCVLRHFRKTVGVEDCHRCTSFLTLIWRHAENCQRTEKCPVFKCHQMKLKIQVSPCQRSCSV
jgi:hypothetical protein